MLTDWGQRRVKQVALHVEYNLLNLASLFGFRVHQDELATASLLMYVSKLGEVDVLQDMTCERG